MNAGGRGKESSESDSQKYIEEFKSCDEIEALSNMKHYIQQ